MNKNLEFKAFIVHLILNGKTEEAIKKLSEHYKIPTPKIKIGMPKGNLKNAACYMQKTKTMHFQKRETFQNPFIVLHEFYHHLRTSTNMHGGIEKNADKFAENFIKAYKERKTL